MQFDDFEALDDVAQNDEVDDSQLGDHSVRSLKKPESGAEIGLDAFGDFHADANDVDDDQSSVLTEDIIERRRFQGEDIEEGGGSDEEFDNDDIWKSYIPDMAQQEPAKATKNSENVINNFYAGAKQNFLFDNYMLEEDRRSQETPGRRPSGSKSNESLKLSGEKEEISEGGNIMRSKSELETNQKQENIQKNSSLGEVAEEQNQRTSVQRKPQNLEELVMQATQESHHDIKSADIKTATNQSPASSNKVEEEGIFHNDVETAERKLSQETPKASASQPNIEPQSGGIQEGDFKDVSEGIKEDDFQDVSQSQGIQEGDFKSFVDLGDGASEDDSKYEGSYISENDLGSHNEIAEDPQAQHKPWLNYDDNNNLILGSSQTDLEKRRREQGDQQVQSGTISSSQKGSSRNELEVPQREEDHVVENKQEYFEQHEHHHHHHHEQEHQYDKFEASQETPFDDYEEHEEEKPVDFSKQQNVNRNAGVAVQQSLREEETRGEEDMWRSNAYGESLGNSYQPNLLSAATVQGRFGKNDVNLTSVTNEYSTEREEEYYHNEVLTPAQQVNQGITQTVTNQRYQQQQHQEVDLLGGYENENIPNQNTQQDQHAQAAYTNNQNHFWDDITSPDVTGQPASHQAELDLKAATRQISAISAIGSSGQAQNYQQPEDLTNTVIRVAENRRSVSQNEAQPVQQKLPEQVTRTFSHQAPPKSQPDLVDDVQRNNYRRPSGPKEVIQNDSVVSDFRPEAPVTQPEFIRNLPIKSEARRATDEVNTSVNTSVNQVGHPQKKPVQLTLETTRQVSYVSTPPATKQPVQLSMQTTQGVSYVQEPPLKKSVNLTMQAIQGVSYVQEPPLKKSATLTMQAIQGVSYVNIVPEKKPLKLSMETTRGVAFVPVEKKPVEVAHSTQAVQTAQPVAIEAPQRNNYAQEVEAHRVVAETRRTPEKYNTPIRAATKDANRLTPRRIEHTDKSISIKCSIHPSEYIEKVCTDPKYPKKRMLCWECAVDHTKEMTKYRYATQSITQYAAQKVQEYYEADRVAGVPEELRASLRGLKSAEENLSNDISESVSTIQDSLKQMKAEILAKFEELDNTLAEVATGKTKKFGTNREFFETALREHFNKDQKEPIPYDTLIEHLIAVETEKEFEDFIDSLKSEISTSTPEIKSYIKVLDYKVNELTRDTNLPNKGLFKELKSKNLKVSQLYEQLLINLSSIKTTVSELLDSSYTIKDISKTRVVSKNTVTADNMNVTVPLNKISDDILKYRLRFEKKLIESEAKSINCVSVIDNEILAAGTLEQTITLWSLATGEFLESIIAHDDIISGLYPFKVSHSDLKERKPHTSVQSDYTTLLISTGGKFDNTILFWDISWTYDYLRGRITEKQQSRVVRRLEGPNASITSVLPVLDGVTLINGTYDGKICVWNVLKNRLGGEIKQHQSTVSCLKMMHCRRRFASASWDNTICIWKILYKQVYDPETRIQSDRKIFEGCELEKVIDPSFKVQCLGASIVNKNWLAFGGAMNRVVIWDIEVGKLVKEFESDKDNLVEMVLVEDENADKMIVLGVCDDDDAIRAWDTNYKESNELLDEVYNLKSRDKIYINKGNAHGPVLQLVQDGLIKIAAVNSAKSKNCVSLLEVELGV